MTEPKPFYQPLYTQSEQRDLAAAPVDPAALLDEQININRIVIRRMFKLSKDQQPEEQIKTLAILSAVSSRLISSIRTQQQLKAGGVGGGDEYRIMIENALIEVQAEWPKL
jgi:hypothetical protein